MKLRGCGELFLGAQLFVNKAGQFAKEETCFEQMNGRCPSSILAATFHWSFRLIPPKKSPRIAASHCSSAWLPWCCSELASSLSNR